MQKETESTRGKENRERPLEGKIALITGSSRDIGAGIAVALALEGVAIIGNYRDKEKRAKETEKKIKGTGGKIEFVKGDITVLEDRKKLQTTLNESFGGKLDYLILNTSGTRETARQVCVEANPALVREFLSRIREGGTIILMQSVPGHFYNQLKRLGKIPDFYEPIAQAKYEGEQVLQSRILEFREKGASLIVVCPPEVEDTSNMRVFKRLDKSVSEKLAGISDMLGIPRAVTINDVGQKVSELLKLNLPNGYIEFFGNVTQKFAISQ